MNKGLEAVERIRQDINENNDFRNDFKDLETIEQALIEAQEKRKVLNVIKNKNVRIYWIKSYSCVESYNKGLPLKRKTYT